MKGEGYSYRKDELTNIQNQSNNVVINQSTHTNTRAHCNLHIVMFLSFLLCRLLLSLPLLLQPFKQAAIVNRPDSILVEKPFLVFAQGIQYLPLREATHPAIILQKNLRSNGHHLIHARHVFLTHQDNLPSFEVCGFSICLEHLLQLLACEGIRPGVGMLFEYLFKPFRNKSASWIVDMIRHYFSGVSVNVYEISVLLQIIHGLSAEEQLNLS